MKDVRLTITIECHSIHEFTADEVDHVVNGFKQLFSGATKEGYSKVVDVKMEPLV